MTREYDLSIRCFYGSTDYTQHRQTMKLRDIAKWIEAYQFTHPAVESITIKVWLKDEERRQDHEVKQ